MEFSAIIPVANFRDLPYVSRLQHVGIIPVMEIGTELVYGFGFNHRYDDFTDFGGQRERGETFVEGAIREFTEESLGIFGTLQPEQLQSSIGLFSRIPAGRRTRVEYLIFVRFTGPSPAELVNQFQLERQRELRKDDNLRRLGLRVPYNPKLEMSEMIWLTEDDIIDANSLTGVKMNPVLQNRLIAHMPLERNFNI